MSLSAMSGNSVIADVDEVRILWDYTQAPYTCLLSHLWNSLTDTGSLKAITVLLSGRGIHPLLLLSLLLSLSVKHKGSSHFPLVLCQISTWTYCKWTRILSKPIFTDTRVCSYVWFIILLKHAQVC